MEVPLSVVVFPNPASDALGIRSISARSGDARITIRDHSGRLVLQEMVRIRAGATQVTVALPDMANGAYSVTTELNGTILTNPLLIVR